MLFYCSVYAEVNVQSIVAISGSSNGNSLKLGSGFFINKKGWVVTNHHVVYNAKALTIVCHDGSRLAVTGILAEDPVYDMVILETTGEETPYLRMGQTEKITLGKAQAAGLTVGTGRRVISVNVNLVFPDETGQRWIRYDGDVTQGFSGGPVLSMHEFVIGVTTSRSEGGRVANYALVSDRLRELADNATYATSLVNYNWKIPQYKSLRLTEYQDPRYWYNRGVSRLPNLEKAQSEFRKAIDVQVDFAPAYDALWDLALQQEDKSAIDTLRTEIETQLEPKFAKAIFARSLRF